MAVFLILGFSFLGKPFSYVALLMGIVLILDPRPLLRPMYKALTETHYLSNFCWAALLSFLYGIAGLVYGIAAGYDRFQAVQILTYTLYPFYLFLGIWGGTHIPDFMGRYMRFFAWFGAICTPLNLWLLNVSVHFPGLDSETVITFGSGVGILLGIFAYEKNLLRYWFPIAAASFWLIANQVRADWLGFGIALGIWGVATKQISRVLGMLGAITALLAIGYLADLHLAALPGRGGELSSRETVLRAVSIIDPDLALDGTSNARSYVGTIGWRTNWWKLIREVVTETPETTIFGMGYGYPIRDLLPGGIRKSDIRSPHSIFYFALAYGGLLGVCLFFWLQLSVMLLLWRTYKVTGQIFGLAFYVMTLVGAFFGNFMETPQGAIPTYLLAGFCLAPLLTQRSRSKQSLAMQVLRPAYAPYNHSLPAPI